uniref:PIN domain-containing protein n=1 Tax=Tanacetum cinerariifolium TaxID=118510 RepID=A0A699GMT1_TANCI|nr:hypothetical protein [Tanacetum cinerariifolium]
MVAQGGARVRGAEQAAPLQLGHHQRQKIVQPGRQRRRHEIKAVCRLLLEPGLDLVRHRCGGADHGKVSAPARDAFVQLANGQVLALRQVSQQLLAAALAVLGFRQRGQRPVQRIAGQVEIADHAAQQRQPGFRFDQRLQRAELVVRLLLRAAHHGKQAGHDLERVRMTALVRHAALDVVVKILRCRQRGLRREHHVGGGCRQVAPRFRAAGLHHHRAALRAAGDVERPGHGEMVAAMSELADFGRIGQHAARLVVHQRPILPTIPQSCDNLMKFTGPLIALGMAHVLVAAKVGRFGRVVGRDQVPSRPALGDLVERRELARHRVRLVVRGGGGADQADPLGRCGQRGQQRQGFERRDVSRQRHAVGKEHGVQARCFRIAHLLAEYLERIALEVQLLARGDADIPLVVARHGARHVTGGRHQVGGVRFIGQVFTDQRNAPATDWRRQRNAGVDDAVPALDRVRRLEQVELGFRLVRVIEREVGNQAVLQWQRIVRARKGFPLGRERQGLAIEVARGGGRCRAIEAVDCGVGVGQRAGQGQFARGAGVDVEFHATGGHLAGVDQARDHGAAHGVVEIGLVVVVTGVEDGQVGGELAVERARFQPQLERIGRLGLERQRVARQHVEEHVVGRALVAARVRGVGIDGVRQIDLQAQSSRVAVLAGGTGILHARLHAGEGGIARKVQGAFTEQRVAVVLDAVVGAAGIEHIGRDQALVRLAVLAVQVKGAHHVVGELVPGGSDAQLLRHLAEVHRADVARGGIGGRDARHFRRIADGRGAGVLGVVPVAHGRDRRQRMAAQAPVHLRGQATVGIADVARDVGVDLAVVRAGHHRCDAGRERRAGGRRAGQLVRREAGRRVRAQVVGDQRDVDVAVGRDVDAGARALAVVAIDFTAAGMDVVHVAVVVGVQRGERGAHHARCDGARHAGAHALLVALVPARIHVAAGLLAGLAAHHVDHARRGVLAEQRALRPAQDFDAVDVEQVQRGLAGARIHHAIDHGGHGGFHAGRRGNGTDTAHEDRGILVAALLAERGAGHFLEDGVDAVAIGLRQLLAVDHGDGHRHRLQRRAAARGADRHRRNGGSIGNGGSAVGNRRGVVRAGGPGATDQQSARGQHADKAPRFRARHHPRRGEAGGGGLDHGVALLQRAVARGRQAQCAHCRRRQAARLCAQPGGRRPGLVARAHGRHGDSEYLGTDLCQHHPELQRHVDAPRLPAAAGVQLLLGQTGRKRGAHLPGLEAGGAGGDGPFSQPRHRKAAGHGRRARRGNLGLPAAPQADPGRLLEPRGGRTGRALPQRLRGGNARAWTRSRDLRAHGGGAVRRRQAGHRSAGAGARKKSQTGGSDHFRQRQPGGRRPAGRPARGAEDPAAVRARGLWRLPVFATAAAQPDHHPPARARNRRGRRAAHPGTTGRAARIDGRFAASPAPDRRQRPACAQRGNQDRFSKGQRPAQHDQGPGHAGKSAGRPADQMDRIPGRPADARGAQRGQHRFRQHRRAAARVCAGRRRGPAVRWGRAGTGQQRGDLRVQGLPAAHCRATQGQACGISKGVGLALPAGVRAAQGGADDARHRARVPVAVRCARGLRFRQHRCVGGMGSVFRVRAKVLPGAGAGRLHGPAAGQRLLPGVAPLHAAVAATGERLAGAGGGVRSLGQCPSEGNRCQPGAADRAARRPRGHVAGPRALWRHAGHARDRGQPAARGRPVLRAKADSQAGQHRQPRREVDSMHQNVYIDTSVIRYLTAPPSRDPVIRGCQELTRQWWEKRCVREMTYISDAVLDEIKAGDPVLFDARMHIADKLVYFRPDPEVDIFAELLILGGGLNAKARIPAQHIASAAFQQVQVLLSWNCVDIANAHNCAIYNIEMPPDLTFPELDNETKAEIDALHAVMLRDKAEAAALVERHRAEAAAAAPAATLFGDGLAARRPRQRDSALAAAVAVEAGRVQTVHIRGPQRVLLAAELIQVVPGEDARVVAVRERRLHRVVTHRLHASDAHVALAGLQRFLAWAVAHHLGRWRVHAQQFERDGKRGAVVKRNIEHFRHIVHARGGRPARRARTRAALRPRSDGENVHRRGSAVSRASARAASCCRSWPAGTGRKRCWPHSYQHPFDAAVVGALDVVGHPVLAQQVLGDLDHDVVGRGARILAVARHAAQAGRAAGEDFHFAVETVGAQLVGALDHFFFLAEAYLRGHVGTGNHQGARVAAAAVVLFDLDVVVRGDQAVDGLGRFLQLHRRMARLVVHIAGAGHAFEPDLFLQQIFMNVHDAAAGEDLVELVGGQLVVAGAARHQDRLDVEIVERVGHAVEQHAVIGHHLLGLVELAGAALRITAAQVARRQDRLHAHFPQHRLRGQAHLREQALRAAAGEVEHGFRIGRGALRIADDGHHLVVFDVEQRARRLLRQPARHFLVDEVNHLLAHGRLARGRRRRLGLLLGEFLEQVVAQALGLVADAHHRRAGGVDGGRIGGVEEEHRCRFTGIKTFLVHLAQQVAHIHRHVAEVDVDRTGRDALVTDGTVVGHVFELFPVLDRHATARLLFVQECFDQRRRRQDLVARRVQHVGARHVGRAHGLALAAAQAVLDAVGDFADIALLHDQRFVAHQAERRRIGIGQVRFHAGQVQQLALVEAAFRIDAQLVVAERADFLFVQELELGDADAVFARDHAVERTGQLHDARDGLVRQLQHLVVVGVDRQVGVDIAVARVHVQRHEYASAQHAFMDGRRLVEDQFIGGAVEDLAQLGADFLLPRHADGAVLHHVEQRGVGLGLQAFVEHHLHAVHAQRGQLAGDGRQRFVELGQQEGPARMHLGQQRLRLLRTVAQHLGVAHGVVVHVVVLAHRQIASGKKCLQFIDQLQLVLDRQLDVDALDAVRVLAHAVQRDHHVFVDLEGIGVAGNGGRAGPVEPEFLARLGADGHEAFAHAGVGNADHFGGGQCHRVLVVAHDVAEQRHLGQHAALGLGGVADRAQVALVQVLQTGQAQSGKLRALGGQAVQVILDFHDRRNRIAGLAEELEAHGARELRHLVQDPAAGRDQAVRALFLDARQAGQEFVGHVLAQAFLAEGAAGDFQDLGLERRAFGLAACGRVGPLELETGQRRIVDFRQVVVEPRDVEPVAVRVHHAPRGQVVERRAPQHGLLAACVHGDIAADARRVRRGGIDRKHEARFLGRFRHFIGDHAGARVDGRVFLLQARQHLHFHRAHVEQFFRVDHGRHGRQGNRAARVAGAAAARDDGQSQLDTAFDQAGHLLFGVGREHDKRVLDAPVGGVGHVRHALHAVETDIVLFRVAAQHLVGALAQVVDLLEFLAEVGHGLAGRTQQLGHVGAALARGLVVAALVHRQAPLVHLGQAVMQRGDQFLAPLGVVQHIVLQVRIAAHRPDVAQHFVQHASRAAGLARAAQRIQQRPRLLPQQPDDDLAIGKRRVVVWDFPQAGGLRSVGRFRQQSLDLCRGIHIAIGLVS